MQYQVPQFIEVEDKIFGPFTLKQFIYLAGGVGISVTFLLTLPFFAGILLSIPFMALGLALAFVKINERPFVEVLESAFFFMTNGKMYLWKKGSGATKTQEQVKPQAPIQPQAQVPQAEAMQKIRSLAWSLDVKDQENLHGK